MISGDKATILVFCVRVVNQIRRAAVMTDRPWLKAYEPGVRPFIHIPDISVANLLLQAAKSYPERPAVIHRNVIWTYSELFAKVRKFASFLRSLHVAAGERILLAMENSPEWLVTFLAVAEIGGKAVLLCPCLSDEELRTKALRSKAVGIVADAHTFSRLFNEEFASAYRWAVRHSGTLQSVSQNAAEAPCQVFEFSEIAFTEAGSARTETNRKPLPTPLDLTLVQFHEGVNGEEIQLRHRSLLVNAYQTREWLNRVGSIDKILLALPLSHVFSLSLGVLLALIQGAAVIIPKDYDFFDTLQAIHDYTPEVVVATAKVYSTIAGFTEEAAQEYLLWPVQAWLSVWGNLAPKTLMAFQELTGRPVIETFAIGGCVVTHLNPILQARLGSIGVPIPNTDAKIVDLETGSRRLAAGEVGELVVAGDQLQEDTFLIKSESRRPFYYSGELAWMDEDGFFYRLGSKGEAIVTGRRFVFPAEVEMALKNHPAVKECICVGLRDFQGKSYIKALVILDKEVSEEELMAYCRLNLSPYKVPRKVEILSDLPQTSDGKVLRLWIIENEINKEKSYLQ